MHKALVVNYVLPLRNRDYDKP